MIQSIKLIAKTANQKCELTYIFCLFVSNSLKRNQLGYSSPEKGNNCEYF